MFLLLCSETSLYLTTNTKYEMEVDTVRGGMLQVQVNRVKGHFKCFFTYDFVYSRSTKGGLQTEKMP